MYNNNNKYIDQKYFRRQKVIFNFILGDFLLEIKFYFFLILFSLTCLTFFRKMQHFACDSKKSNAGLASDKLVVHSDALMLRMKRL